MRGRREERDKQLKKIDDGKIRSEQKDLPDIGEEKNCIPQPVLRLSLATLRFRQKTSFIVINITSLCDEVSSRIYPNVLYNAHCLLTNEDTAVPHLAFAEGLHRLLNSLSVQREGHRGRGNLLLGSKLHQRAQTVARCNKRTLDSDTLDVHHEQRDGRGSQVDGQWVD